MLYQYLLDDVNRKHIQPVKFSKDGVEYVESRRDGEVAYMIRDKQGLTRTMSTKQAGSKKTVDQGIELTRMGSGGSGGGGQVISRGGVSPTGSGKRFSAM